MEKKIKDLQRAVESLTSYNDDIDQYTDNDFINYRGDIHDNIDAIKTIPDEIRQLSNQIEDLELNSSELKQKKEQKEKIIEKLEKIEEEGTDLISRIKDKEKRFASIPEEESSPGVQRSDSIGGQMKLITLQKNADYLEQRRKELEQTKQASAEVYQLSSAMKEKIVQQGDMLNDIETNVDKAENNIEKAQFEIQEADKLQKQAGSRTKCFVLIVLGAVLAILAIVLIIYFASG